MHSPELDDPLICAICAVPLNFNGWMEQPWHHPTERDHLAIPVKRDNLVEINWSCDFCSRERARWAVPANDFRTPVGSTSIGDWCLCDECKPLVESREWLTIVRRIGATYTQTTGLPTTPGQDAYLFELYLRLEKNITGPIYLNPPRGKESS